MPLVAGAALPLAFIAAGLLALGAATAWFAFAPGILRSPPGQPRGVALAHLWLPGFLLSACAGAVYQLMPVVLGTALRSPLALAWSHFVLHVTGTLALVLGLAGGNPLLAAVGGAAIAIGAGVFAAITWRTFAAAKRRDAIAWSFPLASTWLLATVLAGVILALNRRDPFLPVSTLDLLAAHAHLGLAGFFLTLLQGATFQLVPMFTLAPPPNLRTVAAGLVMGQFGLLTLVPALAAAHRVLILVGGAMLVTAIGFSGWALAATLGRRRRRRLEPGVLAFVIGAVVLGLAAPGALVLAWHEPPVVGGAVVVYGGGVIAGALSFMIAGMLGKIVPFLVWMRIYGPRAGRQPVPLATRLGSRFLELGWLAGHGTALLLLGAGTVSGADGVLHTGAALLLIAVVLLLANFARVARHLFTASLLPAPAGSRRQPSSP